MSVSTVRKGSAVMDEEEQVKTGLESLTVENDGPAEFKKERNSTASTPDPSKGSRSPSMSPDDQKTRSDSASTPDGNQPFKLTRKASQKVAAPPVFLYDLPDVTEESKDHFQLIPDCLYGSRQLGSTDVDTLDCDCNEEWRDGLNHACGEDSDCINRVTKMECVDRECNCGDGCQNQRFQRRQYADVSVIKTEKKGFGLRANSALNINDFIFEYIGEVINEPTFRRRMRQYDNEGIKHFYFMSLDKREFVDATKKGNLGRFCNHSCNPNCYVDKWVVGSKVRMGIFAGRKIQAGEELVFNYNVDRYGADPQPCYCGEPNCIGFIGGKTQTERATKLSDATIEALGIDDGDSWDTTVAVVKKPRKKRVGEDDEEYVNSVQARGLDERGVQKVMASLMQCKEKWIAVKLLERIQTCEERLLPYVVRMHGYEFLKTTLNTFKEDHNVVLQILNILYRFPRLTKNKIVDSKIESAIESLTKSEHEDVANESKTLLDEWSKLEVGYRIPRQSRNAQGKPPAQPTNSFDDRRGFRPEEPSNRVAASITLPENVPRGPRSSVPQRNNALFNSQRQRRPPDQASLPAGWFITTDPSGSWYYYTKSGVTQWQKPTAPATEAASQKGPTKAMQDAKTLQDIIDSLTKPDSALRRSASQTPQQVSTPAQEPKKEKWRSLPIEKQMKIYENTLFPHVKYVMDKFSRKLPKEDLKKFSKEINKKLVASDYKNKRVDDPTSISDKQVKKVKNYVKDFFEKAVKKHDAHEKRKAERAATTVSRDTKLNGSVNKPTHKEEDVVMTDDEDNGSTPGSVDRKRKRDDDGPGSASATPSETPSVKRLKEDVTTPPTPPPPPPPPEHDAADVEMGPQDNTLHDQEEALIRENEEAQRAAEQLREQEAALERENELNLLDFEREQHSNEADIHIDLHGSLGGRGSNEEDGALQHTDTRKHEVMSH